MNSFTETSVNLTRTTVSYTGTTNISIRAVESVTNTTRSFIETGITSAEVSVSETVSNYLSTT
jgi:hypothetical protein